jgi:hypothetical protein
MTLMTYLVLELKTEVTYMRGVVFGKLYFADIGKTHRALPQSTKLNAYLSKSIQTSLINSIENTRNPYLWFITNPSFLQVLLLHAA